MIKTLFLSAISNSCLSLVPEIWFLLSVSVSGSPEVVLRSGDERSRFQIIHSLSIVDTAWLTSRSL